MIRAGSLIHGSNLTDLISVDEVRDGQGVSRPAGVLVEWRVHGGCEQGSQLSDVVESVDAEDGFFDGGLALGSDDAVCQLGVLFPDVGVGQAPVTGAARVDDLGGAGAAVGEG